MLTIEYYPVENLTAYEKNARIHDESDIEAIKYSIENFGFNDPIGIWGERNIIVEGHGRLEAAKQLGMLTVPCIRLDHLNEEERKTYALAHNRTAELSKWDWDSVKAEIQSISTFDMKALGFADVENMAIDLDDNDEQQCQKSEELHKCPKCGFLFAN